MKVRSVAYILAVGTVCLGSLGSSALAEDTPDRTTRLTSLTGDNSQPGHAEKPGDVPATSDRLTDPAAVATPVNGNEYAKPIPLTFSIDYTVASDYVWRGQNLSEYATEGREKLNHQLGLGLSYDTERFGTFSGLIWFEWFAGQESLDPTSGSNHQETDYTLSWSIDIDAIATTVEFGWIGYQFPQAVGDASFTHEWYVALGFDDSKLFGTAQPVLSPSVAYYMDVDDIQGSWIEGGVSHDFALAECSLTDTPILKDITLTPSLIIGIDHGQISNSTKLANMQYGLDVAYDLSSAFGIPENLGELTLTGFLRYSDALYEEVLNDEFWGGATVGYSW